MKKHICLVTIIVCLLFVGCDKKLEEDISNKVISKFDNVEMVVNSFENDLIQYTIYNHSDKPITYMPQYYIERQIDGTYHMSNITIFFAGSEETIDSNSSVTLTANMSSYYKTVESGKYRLLKEVNNSLIQAEFEVK